MMRNAPAGGGFDAFGDHHIPDLDHGVHAKDRDIPVMPEVDDRVPGPDSGSRHVPLTDLERLEIIRDINRGGRNRIADLGIPAYAPNPHDQLPGGPRPPESYEARPRRDVMRPLVMPGEGIDSTKGLLGDLRSEIHGSVHDAIN